MSISLESLKEAISIKQQIAKLEAMLVKLMGGAPTKGSAAKTGRRAKRKNKMSAAGRAKIAAAQKARWAKVKKASTETEGKKKRVMSKAGRARIVAAQKARWAAARK